MKIKIARALLVALAMVWFMAMTSGCGSGYMAKVNGKPITSEELDHRVELLENSALAAGQDFSGSKGEELRQQLKKQALEELIQEELVLQLAEKIAVPVPEDQVNQRLEELESQLGKDKLEEILQQQKVTRQDLEHRFLIQMTAEAVFDQVTSDVSLDGGEAEEYFQAHREEMEKMKVAHILVEDRDKALSIIKQLDRGGDFARLAREESQDASNKDNGGIIDQYFTRQDPYLVPEFVSAAFTLEEGQYSPQPVETQFGFHIIKVMDKQDLYDELKEDTSAVALNDKKNQLFQQKLEEFRTQSKVENKLP